MKTSLIPTVLVFALVTLVQAESDLKLTNDVQISEGGVRLIISGGDLPWLDPNAVPEELKVEAPLSFALHGSSSYSHGLLWLRGSNCCAVDLATTNGIPVPKTPRGRSMGAGPKSLKDVRDSAAVPKSFSAGNIEVGDFPRLTDLFLFPSNGVYVLEVKCWAWSQNKRSFVLSAPVRVRVVRGEKTNEPAPRK
jgi:hypothetical protein